MFWLLLSILTNSALLLVLKAFGRFGVNTLHGIVVNYLVAGLMGILVAGVPLPVREIPQQSWALLAPLLGMLFISVFLLIARTTQTMGVSVATVANKMSVVIPVAAALVFYGERFRWLQLAGMILTLAAVYLTALPARSGESKQVRKLWLPLLVFLGSGVIDALVNESKRRASDAHLPFLISLCFLSAFVIGFCIVIGRIAVKKETFAFKSVIAGIVLGVPNYFSIYGMTRALGASELPSAALYPLNNMGVVLVSAVGALVLFREKLSGMNWIGILVSLAAIALIAFG